jgi:hypothetical protein
MNKSLDSSLLLFLLFLGSASPAYAIGEFETDLGYLFIALIVIVVILLILREFTCWYWKINERIALMKEIRDALQSHGSVASSHASPRMGNILGVSTTTCPKCGQTHMGDLRGQVCEGCGEKL